MKRIITLALVAVVAFGTLGLAACSNERDRRDAANATVRVGNTTITTTVTNGTVR